MANLFAWVPESVTNTVKIAERCNLEISQPGPMLLEYEIPEGFSSPMST